MENGYSQINKNLEYDYNFLNVSFCKYSKYIFTNPNFNQNLSDFRIN